MNKKLKPARWENIAGLSHPAYKMYTIPQIYLISPLKKNKNLDEAWYSNPSRYDKILQGFLCPPPQKKNLYHTPNIPDLSPKSKNLYESFWAPLLYVELSAPKKEKQIQETMKGGQLCTNDLHE